MDPRSRMQGKECSFTFGQYGNGTKDIIAAYIHTDARTVW